MKYNLAGKATIVADVPCGDCHICCQKDLIFLHPECGDKNEDYEYEPAPYPFIKRFILKHSKDGNCIYLGENGCKIHGKAPAICQEFDCRGVVKRLGYIATEKMIKKGMLSRKLVNRGKKLMREQLKGEEVE